jgi:hypothetical protein
MFATVAFAVNTDYDIDLDVVDSSYDHIPGITYKYPLYDNDGDNVGEKFMDDNRISISIDSGSSYISKLKVEEIDGDYYVLVKPKISTSRNEIYTVEYTITCEDNPQGMKRANLTA